MVAKKAPTLELRGAVLALWETFCDEVLVCGPAGTGKTRGILERVHYLGERFPGCRILWVRQTLKSLRQSVMVTWEDEVLTPGSPWLNGTASRATRDSYIHQNGTEVVLAGADTPEKFLSTQYDFIICWEARELSFDTIQVLASRNRNGFAPFQQMVFDTNPAGASHHLNKRFPPGYRVLPENHPARRIRPFADNDQQVRLLSIHKDNPGFFDADGEISPRGAAYMRKLDRLVGARKRNLRDGDWASEEGVVWENWDESIHMVDADNPDKPLPKMLWTFASFDKGTRQPGCMGVWGVDAEGAMYELAEVYRVGMDIDWWAQVAVELDNEFHFKAAVSDHHPEWVQKFNDYMNAKGRSRIWQNAQKDWITSVQLVEQLLSPKDGGPYIFFVRGNLRYGRCPLRDEHELPACTVEEIPEIVWAKGVDGKALREEIDPVCHNWNHGFDMTRYAAMFRWKRDLAEPEPSRAFAEGTLGHLFGHDELLGPQSRAHYRTGPQNPR